MRGADGRRQPAARARRRVQHLRRRHAAGLSRHRPRQGAGAGRQGQRHLQRAAVDAGRLLRQRLQPVRPHLAGQRRRPKRASATRSRTSIASMSATATGAMVPIRALAQAQLVQGPQAVMRYNGFRARGHQRRAQARLQLRPGARGDGAGLGHDPAAGLRLRMDRHGAAGEGGERPDRHRARPRRAVRLSLPGGALRELEHPDAGAAVGQRRRAGRDRARSRCRGSPSTSMPRSAWSCWWRSPPRTAFCAGSP